MRAHRGARGVYLTARFGGPPLLQEEKIGLFKKELAGFPLNKTQQDEKSSVGLEKYLREIFTALPRIQTWSQCTFYCMHLFFSIKMLLILF